MQLSHISNVDQREQLLMMRNNEYQYQIKALTDKTKSFTNDYYINYNEWAQIFISHLINRD
jgi:hypothetical protein